MKQAQIILTLQVPKDLAIKARVLASQQNLSRSAFLRRAIERFVAEETAKEESNTNRANVQTLYPSNLRPTQ